MAGQRWARPVVPAKGERTHQIDGLRGVALALVIVAHLINDSLHRVLDPRGLGLIADGAKLVTTSGLDLLLVVSAYLLLTPYLRDERHLTPLTYAKRRVLRLWPSYLVALLFGGAVVAIIWSRATWYSPQMPHFSLGGMAAQAGIVNFGWASYSGAWWSLTLEVLFYLCLPGLVALLTLSRSTRGDRAVVAVVVALSVVSFLVASPIGVINVHRMGAQVLAYAPCFAMGMLLARFRVSTRLSAILIASGAVLAVIGIIDHGLNAHVGLGIFYAGLIGLAISPRTQPRKFLAQWKLVWFGERSYSMFLMHLPVFYLIDYLVSTVIRSRGLAFDALSRGIGLPLALLAGMTLFWYVERRNARGLVSANNFWPWPAVAIGGRASGASGPATVVRPGDGGEAAVGAAAAAPASDGDQGTTR